MLSFDFSENYVLENERARLIPLKISHVGALVSISKEDNLWTYMLDKPIGREKLIQYVLSAMSQRHLNKEYSFVIFDKIQNAYAGMTRLYEYSEELKNIKLGHTWYGEKFRNTGLNKHCKYLLFQFIFDKLQLERIGFGIHSENKISLMALKSVGCKKEGVLRNFLPSIDGSKRTDIVLMSIIAKEWKTDAKRMLQQKLNIN